MSEEKKIPGTTLPLEPQKSAADAVRGPADGTPAEGAPKGPPDFSKKAWDESYKPQPWNATPQGRLAIRAVSRGVLGAVFYTTAGLWTKRLMDGYNPTASFGNQKNWMQTITKICDSCLGKPIELTVNLFGFDGVKATHFRPTKYKTDYGPTKGVVRGRTLGEEMMFVTFDFFSMSVGDAMGRDIIGWFDPAVKKTWLDEKGNIKPTEAIKSMLNSMWSYVSYYGGEDIAAAPFYVYYMKGQRYLLEKLSPGWKYNFDTGSNNSLKIADGKVVGSFSLEEMIDLQGRFTFYNILTLMFRELYDKIAHAFSNKKVSLYGASDAPVDPNRTFLDDVKDVFKWIMRSVIKGVICMTPAVPFFSLIRSTQARHRGLLIDPTQNAAVGFTGNDGKDHYFYANDVAHNISGAHSGMHMHYASFDDRTGSFNKPASLSTMASAQFTARDFDPYQRRHNLLENFFSWLGKKEHDFAGIPDPAVDKFEKNFPKTAARMRDALAVPKPYDEKSTLKRVSRAAANAGTGYWPYMYMKKETALLWDTGKMDLAAEGFVDGVVSGNWSQAWNGLGEIGNSIMRRPFADRKRDREANKRTMDDTSAADGASLEEATRSHEQLLHEQERFRLTPAQSEAAYQPFEQSMQEVAKKHNLKPRQSAADIPWQQRVIHGRASEDSSQVVSTKHAPQSHSEREDMRKAFEGMHPLTNSVH